MDNMLSLRLHQFVLDRTAYPVVIDLTSDVLEEQTNAHHQAHTTHYTSCSAHCFKFTPQVI